MVIEMDCLFCKIGSHEIPSKILYEDETIIAFLDIHPSTDGHTLIIPKKHVEDFTEVDSETWFHMKEVAKLLTDKIMTTLNKKGMTLSINYKEAQEIKHLHLHLLPDLKYKKKTLPIDEIYQALNNTKM